MLPMTADQDGDSTSNSSVRSNAVRAARQEQFLDVIDCDEARRRFHTHLRLEPLGAEAVALPEALDRVLAQDVVSDVDVPAFDRANVDGFAVHAADTFGATDANPRVAVLNDEVLSPGAIPTSPVRPGTATTIATGAPVPRGADAVLMVEFSDVIERPDKREVELRIARAVAPGEHITFAGTDIARGETVLRAGQLLTSREIGVLAAIGVAQVAMWRKPRVAILSTGDEIIAPGDPPRPGAVYDSNAAILAAAVRELGAEPVSLGIVADDEALLSARVNEGLQADLLLLSGGTSKGAGDLSYRVVSRLTNPGIVAHGVALKPGKPICLAVAGGKPLVILPGFPTSAIFTFHEFVAPVIRALGGRPAARREQVAATLPVRVNSERGRTEYLLVNLVRQIPDSQSQPPIRAVPSSPSSILHPLSSIPDPPSLLAFPMGKGSGSVTTFSGADGFITIDQHTELLDSGAHVDVQLLGQKLEPADLVVIGSHCVGMDYLLGQMPRRGWATKSLYVGSTGGLHAARRGQCDLAGVHLFDPATGEYNRPFLGDDLALLPGYRRLQGLLYRRGDARFEGQPIDAAVAGALADASCTLVNRNPGSGTRVLLDRLLAQHAKNPSATPGYAMQAKSHNAVAAAVSQGRADWGLAIDTVAAAYDLGFLPLQEEHYDFVVPKNRLSRPAVQEFQKLLQEPEIRDHLQWFGFRL